MKRIHLIYTILFASFLLNNILAADNRPNIMIIMVDDMGFSDPGCFGGEIQTPNIDSLAYNGVRLVQFYNSARCCPTRASLLTGLYPHQVGLTNNGQSLTTNCVTIAEALKMAGYQTGMTGKWHLSLTKARANKTEQLQWLANRADYGPFAPLETYPCNRGFDEHWGIIWGVANFFNPFSLVHNEERIDSLPNNFYLSNFITEKTIELLDTFATNKAPFFMYVAHAAPHWPLHALPEDIAKYQGVYDSGWDSLRIKRYKRQLEMGLFGPEIVPNALNESGTEWAPANNKEKEANHFETHAAMIDRVDQGIGQIIAKLKETEEFDNTIIFFLSDNGASPERPQNPGFDRPGHTRNGSEINYSINGFNNPGNELTFSGIGQPWAGAANTPWRYWKKESFHGGNCTPFIIHWPNGLKVDKGLVSNYIGHVKDVMPTCLELASANYPKKYNGNHIQPLEGKSLVPFIKNEVVSRTDTIFWEHAGGKAARAANWKIASLKNGSWELFNLENDLSETNNLAAKNPEKVRELVMLWNKWAKKVGLDTVPVPGPAEDVETMLLFNFPFNNNLNEIAYNYQLTGQTTASFADGKFNQALLLDGATNFFDLNTNDILNTGTTPFSVCAWVYNTQSELTGNDEEIVLHQLNGRIMLFNSIVDGQSSLGTWIGGNLNHADGEFFFNNKWQHIAVTSNPATKKHIFYVDGEKVAVLTSTGAFEHNNNGFRIGAHKVGTKGHWHGKIDELRLYKGILTQTEIVNIMDNKQVFSAQYVTTNNCKVFPNPANNFIRLPVQCAKGNFALYNTRGEILKSGSNSNYISTSNIPNGLYILKIHTENTSTIVVKVFIQH